MAIRMANPSTLGILRGINNAAQAVSTSSARLSSGMRINNASDDAAGLSISSNLQLKTRVYTQGIRNFNDGTSMLNIADGTLQQLQGIVIRIRELAQQSANGTFSHTQRKAINTEAQSLAQEYFRISRSTEFNGLRLFNGSVGSVTLQGGFRTDGSITSNLGGALGTGTFSAGVSTNFGGAYSGTVATGDVNGDGNADYVTISDTTVRVMLGDGQGTFSQSASYSMNTLAIYDVALADLNNDGVLDLLTAGASVTNGTLSVRYGNGNGTFGSLSHYNTESIVSNRLALADINNDGAVDVVTAGSGGGGGYATVLLNTGSGSFQASRSYFDGSSSTHDVALADINGDGILDMATLLKNGIGDGYLTIRYGTGTGTFGASTTYDTLDSAGIDYFGLVAADINGDNKADLITSGDSRTSVFLTTSSGISATPTTYTGGGPIALGDINGDGAKDIVGSGSVLLGTGSGTFVSGATFQAGQTGVAVADFNGDGVEDVVTSGWNISSDYSYVVLGNTRNGVAPLLTIDLTTKAGALQSISILDRASSALSIQRGTIGAFQSRLQFALPTLSAINENSSAAISRIRDVDVAEEAANYVRHTIRQQAATAVMAQANQSSQIIVNLLRGI